MKLQLLLLMAIIFISLAITKATPLPEVKQPSFFEELASKIETKSNTFANNLALAGDLVQKQINTGADTVGQAINKEWQLTLRNLNNSVLVFKKTLGNVVLNEENAPAPNLADALIAENPPSASLTVKDCKPNIDEQTFSAKIILVKYLNYSPAIFSRNTKQRWPIASVTKLMTAVVAVEKMGWDSEVAITQPAVAQEGKGGNFKVGEKFKVRDLIEAMLLISSNDAAAALAEHYGKQNFIAAMQEKTAELKMADTSFFESTGLSFLNQSTAEDLVKLTNYIYKNHPALFEISQKRELKMTELKSGKTRALFNINALINYPGFIGGKNGYIEESDHNLVTLVNHEEEPVLFIVLGAKSARLETLQLFKLCF